MPMVLFPLVSNGFLSYLPSYIKKFDLEFAMMIVKDMCDWLHREIKGFVVTINL